MHELLTPKAIHLHRISARSMWKNVVVAVLGFAIYGWTVGFWRSPVMGVFVAVKLPLLIVLTLGCNGLLNGLLGILLGSGLGFRQSLHSLLSAFAISGAILGAVAPVAFFLAINVPAADSAEATSAHAGYLLAHVFLIGVAGLAGVLKLGALLEDFAPTKGIARTTLVAWISGNAFLGAQFSWVLRPFFGSPGLEVGFLRENPMRGSFYEAVWRSVARILPEIHPDFLIGLVIAGLFAAFISIERKYRKNNKDHEE